MRIILTVSLAAISVCLTVQARTWTNTEGKTLDADLVRVKGDTVYLEMDSTHKIHPLQISLLSESDQAFIREYEQKEAERKKAEALAIRKTKWLTDYDDVKAESEKFNLPILLLYTAPEWCGYCVKLEDNILSKEVFEEYAKSNLVLFLADFSKKSDAEDWAEEYPQLKKDFPCKGYPTAYLISTDGKNLGNIVGCDAEWTPQEYISRLEKMKSENN